VVKNAAEKKTNRQAMVFFKVQYTVAKHIMDGDCCAFCQEIIKRDDDDMMLDSNGEVGEFWSETLQASVLAHPDCTPLGIDAIFNGKDPEWKMA
jgi:hypothetical protein